MNLIIYKNSSDKNVVDKTVESVDTFDVEPYTDVSCTKGIYILSYDERVISSNYCYIDTFKRYYFINDVTLQTGGKMTISVSVDVLMSFKNEIRNLSGIVERQQNLANYYLNDNNFQCESKVQTVTKLFPYSHFDKNSNNYVLKVVG